MRHVGRVALAVASTVVAGTASAQTGIWFPSFADGSCVAVSVSSPRWVRSTAQAKATEEYRELTAAEKARIASAGYEVASWNDDQLPCRGIRPSALVVTDHEDHVRARFDFPAANVRREVKANAFGVTGEFFHARVRVTQNALRAAFSEDGVVHLLTSDGTRTVTFKASDVAPVYETEAEQAARKARDEHARAEREIASALTQVCTANSFVAEVHLKSALTLAKDHLSHEETVKAFEPHMKCLEERANSTRDGRVEAAQILAFVRGE
jgi:hypothetical protein